MRHFLVLFQCGCQENISTEFEYAHQMTALEYNRVNIPAGRGGGAVNVKAYCPACEDNLKLGKLVNAALERGWPKLEATHDEALVWRIKAEERRAAYGSAIEDYCAKNEEAMHYDDIQDQIGRAQAQLQEKTEVSFWINKETGPLILLLRKRLQAISETETLIRLTQQRNAK